MSDLKASMARIIDEVIQPRATSTSLDELVSDDFVEHEDAPSGRAARARRRHGR